VTESDLELAVREYGTGSADDVVVALHGSHCTWLEPNGAGRVRFRARESEVEAVLDDLCAAMPLSSAPSAAGCCCSRPGGATRSARPAASGCVPSSATG
jgi:hypothetical protein